MREKFPVAVYKDIAKVAKYFGFYFYRQGKGSHEIWRRDSDGRQTTVPNHGQKSIKRKTLKAILDDFGIHWKEFIRISKKM